MPRKEKYKKYKKQTIEYNTKWAKRNPEKVKEYNKKYRKTEKRKVSVKKYNISEKGKKNRKEWFKKNEKHMTNYRKVYGQRPEVKEKSKIQTHKRRAIIKNLKEHFTLSEWETLKAKWDYRCLACGKQAPDIKLSPDHIIPLCVGGKNTIDNIQPLCLLCNLRKNKKIIDYRLLVD